MKLYQVSHLKHFMKQLLLSDCFDWFLLKEGTITTSNTFHIDGQVQKDFYSSDEIADGICCPYDYSEWKEIRPLCMHLIKGKRTPLFFKFVLLLSPVYTEKILAGSDFRDTNGWIRFFTLTIKYDGNHATLMTGISTSSFLPDHTPEQIWDQAFSNFLKKNQLETEEL